MNAYKWILLGWFLFTLMVTWYMVDRPRRPYSPGVAFGSTIVTIILGVLVVLA